MSGVSSHSSDKTQANRRRRPLITLPSDLTQIPYDTDVASFPGFDPTPYRHYLEDIEISEAQGDELIHTLYQIMTAFVDLGFGINPVPGSWLPDIKIADQALSLELGSDAKPRVYEFTQTASALDEIHAPTTKETLQ